jgi:hypothetical protein
MVSAKPRRRGLVWMLVLVLIAGCGMSNPAGSDSDQVPTIKAKSASGKSAKNKRRVAPDAVEPLILNGRQYDALHFGKARGLQQNGGYIVVTDAESGEELELIQIYRVKYHGDMERDKQDVFITEINQSDQADTIEVSNERGQTFELNLVTGKVIQN